MSPLDVGIVLMTFLIPLYILLVRVSAEEEVGYGVKGGEAASEQEAPVTSHESPEHACLRKGDRDGAA
jgi:hypothetical protein